MNMQKVILKFPCQPGKGADLLDVFTVALVDTRAFDGCLSVDTFTDARDSDLVVLIEDWETRDQNKRYMAWRAETGMAEMLQEILAGPMELHYLEAQPA
jgi:quinol monooxygenase YgiN